MNVWPSTLPQKFLRDAYQSGTGDGRLLSDTDAGIPKVRRRFSYVPIPLSGTMMMTRAQRTTFETFVNTTLSGGVLPFTFPAQDEDGTWTVQFGRNMPSWTEKGGGYWIVSLDLIRLP